LPLPHQLIDHSRDCFGREKHAEYRDDMGGVGSFNRTNRTLYIAQIHESADKEQTRETLLRHFREWGKIERCKCYFTVVERWCNCRVTLTLTDNVLYNRGIAFVTYQHEANAQFAKEAMQHQSLDMDEILNVRWATEDPNPGGKKAEDDRIAREGRKVIASKLDENLVEAAQTLRALEEGNEDEFYPIEASEEVEEVEDHRPAKRARGETSNSGSSAPAPGPAGILGGDTLENIKYYAEMARKQAEEARTRKTPATAAKPKATGVALLGGYGSDSDDE